MSNLHAHFESHSSDCDGSYSRSWVEPIGEDEDDLDFHNRVVMSTVNTYSIFLGGSLEVTKYDDGVVGLDWSETTDEGARYLNVHICEKDDDDERSTYRDHRAESMGY